MRLPNTAGAVSRPPGPVCQPAAFGGLCMASQHPPIFVFLAEVGQPIDVTHSLDARSEAAARGRRNQRKASSGLFRVFSAVQ